MTSTSFLEKNRVSRREPRQACEIYDGVDTYYLVSHADVVTPDSTKTISGVLLDIPIESQTISYLDANSEIGHGEIQLADISDQITTYLSDKFDDDISLRKKQVTCLYGYRGLEYADFYTTGTHIIDSSISVNTDRYRMQTADLQRTLKDTIFDQVFTNLVTDMTATQTYVIANATASFETIRHDSKFSHLPNTVVGYIKIENERIAWLNKLEAAVSVSSLDMSFSDTDDSVNSTAVSPLLADLSVFSVGQAVDISGSTSNNGTYTIASVTANKLTFNEAIVTEAVASPANTVVIVAQPQFYNCTRGVLNSKAVVHTVDATAAVNRRTQIEEWIYLESNIFKIAYGIYTGIWYNTAFAWPTNWHLDIDTSLIEASQFTDQLDLWDASTDDGFTLRFEGLKKTNAKKFLETQIFMLSGGYQKILNSGNIGFKRAARVISGAAPVAFLTNKDLMQNTSPELHYALRDVINLFSVRWNWDPDFEKYTRITPVIDTASIAKYGIGDRTYDFAFKGMHGSLHTQATVRNIVDGIRDRYSGSPKMMTIVVKPEFSIYGPGDVIHLDLEDVKDHTNSSTNRVNGPFEVQKKVFKDGMATYTLFGSAEAATPIAYETGEVLPDAFYSSDGSNAGVASPTLLTGTSSGGTFTMTANGSLTGGADLTASAAIYYVDENFTIDDGITLSATDNIQLRVNGLLTINGTIDMKGQGHAGGSGTTQVPVPFATSTNMYMGAPGTAGYNGSTQAPGGMIYSAGAKSVESTYAEGKHHTAPYLNLENTVSGSPEVPVLNGLPTDLRGTSGGAGGAVNVRPITGGSFTLGTAGGNGGASGGGLVIICRGMTFGANGTIDVRGDAGSNGSTYGAVPRAYSGSGASGCPGTVYVLLDGSAATYPDNNVVADVDPALIQGTQWEEAQNFNAATIYPGHSHFLGTPSQSSKLSVFRVQYIPKNETLEEDVPAIADVPLSITSADGAATVNVPNRIMVDLSATPPTDSGNYSHSNIYIRETGQTGWIFVGESTGATDTKEWPMKVSTAYDIKAHPVSIDGLESDQYITDTHTAAAETTTISKDVKQNNTNALDSDSIFINNIYSNVKDDQTGVTGSWSVTDSSNKRLIYNPSTDTSVEAKSFVARDLDITSATWDNFRYLEAVSGVDSGIGYGLGNCYVITGPYSNGTTTNPHIGFYFYTDGNIYATWANGSTEYTQSLQAYSAGTNYTLRAEYTPPSGSPLTGGQILFYVDDTLRHTASTSAEMPTGTNGATNLFTMGAYKSLTTQLSFKVGEVKIFQA